MKKYKVYFTLIETKSDGEPKHTSLGTTELIHFPESKVSLTAKAFRHATREQLQANKLQFSEV